MKKWSQIDNITIVETVKEKQIQDILEDVLIVETSNVDLSDDQIKIIGKDIAIEQIEEYYHQKLLKEKLHFLSEIRNNALKGQFNFIDTLIDTLEKELYA